MSRAFSHYNFVQSYNDEIRNASFTEALKIEKVRINDALSNLMNDEYNSARDLSNYGFVRKGEYIKHLNNWLKYFDISQFYFLEFNEISSMNQKSLNNLFEFLNISPVKLQQPIKKNVTKYNDKLESDVKHELQEYFKPLNEKLFNRINKSYDW